MKKLKFFALSGTLALLLNLCSCASVSVSTEPKDASLTVIMYHSFLKDSSRSGKYVITPAQFENDIIYLKSIGCAFVSVKDIESFKHAEGSLPENAVLITMDDGNYNNYTYIYPLLKKYGIPALISPIGYYVEQYTENGDANPAYSVITEDNIREMHSSGLVEFGNHTYNMHGTPPRISSRKMECETEEAYVKVLTEDLKKAEDIILRASGEKPCALVYPYGIISPESYRVARSLGYDILFSCTEGINRIAPGDDIYVLKRFNRPSGEPSSTFFSKIFAK